MKKVNTTLFDLEEIYVTMSHGQIWSTVGSLKLVRSELKKLIDEILNNTFNNEKDVENYNFISKQLIYVDKNIKTLEEALMCCETKIVEKRISMGDLKNFWLN